MNNLADGSLLQAFCKKGNEEALEQLVHRHGPTMLKTAVAALGSTETADDVAQSVFLTMLRKADALDERRSLGPWLHRVTVRLALNQVRATKRRIARESEASLLSIAPGDVLESGTSAVLHEEIAALPERYRIPLIAHYLNGLTPPHPPPIPAPSDLASLVREIRSPARVALRPLLNPPTPAHTSAIHHRPAR